MEFVNRGLRFDYRHLSQRSMVLYFTTLRKSRVLPRKEAIIISWLIISQQSEHYIEMNWFSHIVPEIIACKSSHGECFGTIVRYRFELYILLHIHTRCIVVVVFFLASSF